MNDNLVGPIIVGVLVCAVFASAYKYNTVPAKGGTRRKKYNQNKSRRK